MKQSHSVIWFALAIALVLVVTTIIWLREGGPAPSLGDLRYPGSRVVRHTSNRDSFLRVLVRNRHSKRQPRRGPRDDHYVLETTDKVTDICSYYDRQIGDRKLIVKTDDRSSTSSPRPYAWVGEAADGSIVRVSVMRTAPATCQILLSVTAGQ